MPTIEGDVTPRDPINTDGSVGDNQDQGQGKSKDADKDKDEKQDDDDQKKR